MKAHKTITGTEGVKANNSYFLVPQPANLPVGNSERTLMFWYRKDNSAGVNAFFGYGGMGVGVLFEILSDYFANMMGLHAYAVQTFPTPTPRNVAQHITYRIHILYNQTYVSCFVDGHPMLDGAGNLAMYPLNYSLNTAASDIKIGTGLFYSVSSQTGFFQQIKFWNGVLTQAQIQEEMNSSEPLNLNGIVGAWDLTGTNCTDVSGNGNHGILTGTAFPVQPGIARNKTLLLQNDQSKFPGNQ